MLTRLHFLLVLIALGCGSSETAVPASSEPAEAQPSAVQPEAPPAPEKLRIVAVEAYLADSADRRTSSNLVDTAEASYWNVFAPKLQVIVQVERPTSSTDSIEVALWAREGAREVFAERRTVTPIPQGWDGRVTFTLTTFGCRFLLLQASAQQSRYRAEAYRLIPFECGE